MATKPIDGQDYAERPMKGILVGLGLGLVGWAIILAIAFMA